MQVQEKVNAIKSSDISWLDDKYLHMLVAALNGENDDHKQTATTKIDEWYSEL